MCCAPRATARSSCSMPRRATACGSTRRSSSSPESMALQARLIITGRVQGVGYRDWAVATGRRLRLAGWVRNRGDGAVEALVVGDETAVGEMIEACRRGPALARVDGIDVEPVDLDIMPEGFTLLPTA